MFLFAEGAVIISLVLVSSEFCANSTEAGEPLAEESAMGGRNGRKAFMEGGPVDVRTGRGRKAGFSVPVGANALKLEVGGEVVGEVTGNEVILYPDAVALEWEDRVIWRRLGVVEGVAEGFGVLVSLTVKLFLTGEFFV